MSVGFISLLQQPTLQQLGTVPADAGRCLKPVFLLAAPQKGSEKSLLCATWFCHPWDLRKSSMVSKLLPALCLKAQEKTLEQVERLQAGLRSSSQHEVGTQRPPAGTGDTSCLRKWESSTALSCLSPVCNFPLEKVWKTTVFPCLGETLISLSALQLTTTKKK